MIEDKGEVEEQEGEVEEQEGEVEEAEERTDDRQPSSEQPRPRKPRRYTICRRCHGHIPHGQKHVCQTPSLAPIMQSNGNGATPDKDDPKLAAAKVLGKERDDADVDEFWRSTSDSLRMQTTIDRQNGCQAGKRRKCGLCPAKDNFLYALNSYRKHKDAKHEKKMVCPRCGAGFSSMSYYRDHSCVRS